MIRTRECKTNVTNLPKFKVNSIFTLSYLIGELVVL